MKQNPIILALAATALALGSCSNDNEGVQTAKYITVNTSIGSLTRVTSPDAEGRQKFTDGDKISVYAWTGSATAITATDLVVNNAVNTFDGNETWTASPQMLWKDMTSTHYFMAVYPQRAITDFAADSYTLDTSDQTASDLLAATNVTGLTASNTAVSLQFDHLMSKLVVNLSFRNQFGGTPTVTNLKAKAQQKATVDYLTKTVTATETAGYIELPATTANTAYQSIMVPQSGVKEITLTIDGKDYTYTSASGFSLMPGKYTTVNLIVGRDEITLGSVSINDWGKGDVIEGGEAQN
ncbi:fimbrillin family protein [Bacteroides helcogenes]|uniref:Fimbrillin family protein n=1 Tax=Bacteroides helcogenes (strain ATCC 35417 / DSM 20613 / JCM 6297 / CCUG 15421 / P 36-108) TaxID=693979 RepID=E6SSB5_BACT6|nr:fimbrillin family protein [Bacteroides helcogenes]ADV45166.1 hypothetical protein Bache_3242 [Bacteroides helcogenes P 36-108]MDY5238725.1 fimbrillin family protein [Bacteroides helcogenes]